MERRRTAVLIALNALAVVVFLAWLGWHWLSALSRAFGSASPQSGPGDVAWVFIVLGLAVAGCIVASFLVPPAFSKRVAMAPLLLVVLGQGSILWLEKARQERSARREEARSKAGEAKLREWPRDFVRRGEDDADEFSFLIRDSELKAIVQIEVWKRSQVKARCVGLIDGEHLDINMEEKYFAPIYREFLDREGKSLLDRFKLRYKPDLDLFDFPLPKYRP